MVIRRISLLGSLILPLMLLQNCSQIDTSKNPPKSNLERTLGVTNVGSPSASKSGSPNAQSYGIIGDDSVVLRGGSKINTNVAVLLQDRHGHGRHHRWKRRGRDHRHHWRHGLRGLSIGRLVTTDGASSLKSSFVRVRKAANVQGTLEYDHAHIHKSAVVAKTVSPLGDLPTLPDFFTGTSGTANATESDSPLAPGKYRDVKLSENTTLDLIGGVYQLRNIKLKEGAALNCLGSCTLLVRGRLVASHQTTLGTSSQLPADLQIYVEGKHKRKGRYQCKRNHRAVRLGKHSVTIAEIYSPYGRLKIGKGSTATGTFVARRVVIGRHAVVASPGEPAPNPEDFGWVLKDSVTPGGPFTVATDVVGDSQNFYSVAKTIGPTGQTDFAVRRGDQNAENWTTVYSFSSPGFMGNPAIALRSNGTLYVTAFNDGTVLESTDQGDSFAPVNGTSIGGTTSSLAIDAADNLYVATFLPGAGSWVIGKLLSSGFIAVDAFSLPSGTRAIPLQLAIDGSNSVFAVGLSSDSAGIAHWIVRRSTNGGDSWLTVDEVEATTEAVARSIFADGNVVTVTGTVNDGSGERPLTRQSTDGGDSWITVDAPTGFANQFAVGQDQFGSFWVSGLKPDRAIALRFSENGEPGTWEDSNAHGFFIPFRYYSASDGTLFAAGLGSNDGGGSFFNGIQVFEVIGIGN